MAEQLLKYVTTYSLYIITRRELRMSSAGLWAGGAFYFNRDLRAWVIG